MSAATVTAASSATMRIEVEVPPDAPAWVREIVWHVGLGSGLFSGVYVSVGGDRDHQREMAPDECPSWVPCPDLAVALDALRRLTGAA